MTNLFQNVLQNNFRGIVWRMGGENLPVNAYHLAFTLAVVLATVIKGAADWLNFS